MNPRPPDKPRHENFDSPRVATVSSLTNRPMSYANVARRFPVLVLDMGCENDGERIGLEVIGPFVFDALGLKTEEITRIKGVGSSNKPIVIVTKQEIIISKRFGDKVEFERTIQGKKWNCKIRGGRKRTPLRFMQVPCEVSKQELLNSIESFAIPTSNVEEEVFVGSYDARFKGIGSGNYRVAVDVMGEIPEFVEIGSWRVRINHPAQIRRCFYCGEAGHLKIECRKGLDGTNTAENEGDNSGLESFPRPSEVQSSSKIGDVSNKKNEPLASKTPAPEDDEPKNAENDVLEQNEIGKDWTSDSFKRKAQELCKSPEPPNAIGKKKTKNVSYAPRTTRSRSDSAAN